MAAPGPGPLCPPNPVLSPGPLWRSGIGAGVLPGIWRKVVAYGGLQIRRLLKVRICRDKHISDSTMFRWWQRLQDRERGADCGEHRQAAGAGAQGVSQREFRRGGSRAGRGDSLSLQRLRLRRWEPNRSYHEKPLAAFRRLGVSRILVRPSS
jgi:hypothetical protein